MRPELGPISRHRTDSPLLRQQAAPRTAAVRVDNTPRSRRYLDSFARLDAGTTLTPAELSQIVDDIRREFTERWAALPLGLVSKCYLGHPFEVHTLAPDGDILQHFRLGEQLPGPLEGARTHSLSGLYLAVEVYVNRFVCIRPDGSTVTLGGDDA